MMMIIIMRFLYNVNHPPPPRVTVCVPCRAVRALILALMPWGIYIWPCLHPVSAYRPGYLYASIPVYLYTCILPNMLTYVRVYRTWGGISTDACRHVTSRHVTAEAHGEFRAAAHRPPEALDSDRGQGGTKEGDSREEQPCIASHTVYRMSYPRMSYPRSRKGPILLFAPAMQGTFVYGTSIRRYGKYLLCLWLLRYCKYRRTYCTTHHQLLPRTIPTTTTTTTTTCPLLVIIIQHGKSGWKPLFSFFPPILLLLFLLLLPPPPFCIKA